MKLKKNISFNDFHSFEDNIEKEWLITNGIGGYASSTILGINTRKYHGLLISALDPPGSRTVLLEKLDEDIIINKETYRLGTNEFHDSIYPNGYQYLKKFSINPFPHYTYKINQIKLEKLLFMSQKMNEITTIYDITNKNTSIAKINIYPLINCRNFHDVTNNINSIRFNQKQDKRTVILFFNNKKIMLSLHSTSGTFIKKLNLINNINYREEKLRGESYEDNCFSPGFFEIKVKPKESIRTCIFASSENKQNIELNKVKNNISNHKDIQLKIYENKIKNKNFLKAFYSNYQNIKKNNVLNKLLLSAKSFIVQDRKNVSHILAGYFWFGPWGRDTFISLPGLLLIPHRFNIAKKILYNYSLLIKNGLIPNYHEDKKQEFAFNSVDAPLFYLNSVLQFLKYTGDFGFIQKKIWTKILEIITFYENGTEFGIKMDKDSLLLHGPQLTWMDAMADRKAVTPRSGKAVEIQSLWYNALKIIELLSIKFHEKKLGEKYSELAIKTKLSFNRKFWNNKKNCLYDTIDSSEIDLTVRPNQIFSLSLDFSILNKNKGKKILDKVTTELLTPFGLRTLDTKDPNYRGTYCGNRSSRDTAYHNGTVWPWLLGPYITACYKIDQFNKLYSDKKDNLFISLLEKHLFSAGIGGISEIFDGDKPHKPRGCISQAWSLAEPLRAYVENIMNIKPKFNNLIVPNY